MWSDSFVITRFFLHKTFVFSNHNKDKYIDLKDVFLFNLLSLIPSLSQLNKGKEISYNECHFEEQIQTNFMAKYGKKKREKEVIGLALF